MSNVNLETMMSLASIRSQVRRQLSYILIDLDLLSHYALRITADWDPCSSDGAECAILGSSTT